MAHGGFLINNKISEAESIVVSEGGTATGYDISNVQDEIVSNIYKSTGNTVKIDITMPAAIDFSSIAIINHNIATNVVIVLGLSNTGFTPVMEEEISIGTTNILERYIYRRNEVGDLIKTYAPNTYNNLGNKTFRYFRFTILANEPTTIGSLFIGDTFVFPKNYDQDYNFNFNIEKAVNNIHGQMYEYQISEQMSHKLNFTEVPEEHFEDYKHLLRQGAKIFVPDFDKKPCYYGIVTNSVLVNVRQRATDLLDNFSMNFMENF